MSLLGGTAAAQAQAPPQLHIEKKYPAMSDFMMPQDAEIALARSAAPDNVSSRATIKILTPTGFKVAVEGDNGSACLVLRGWGCTDLQPRALSRFHLCRRLARADLLRPGFRANDDAVLRATP